MKGLSPLIATTLLIVMVVSLSAIIISFSTTFTRGTTENIENRTTEAVDCSGANIDISDVFLTNGSAATARVHVINSGLKDNLMVVAGQLFNKTGENFTASGLPITGFDRGEILIVSFANVSMPTCANFSHVTITTNCPGVADTSRKLTQC